MIHTIEIDTETEIDSLKKLTRKKLMTGGAVLRLSPDLSLVDKQQIFAKFSAEASEYNLCGQIMAELAKDQEIEQGLLKDLSALELKIVDRVLSERDVAPAIDK